VTKRSPILGFNHNVRYRGLIFHVQTEDSGVLSPHLFTHLFHGGVIVSTRKLVYDAGANEEAIKALMQAQHKAVMKDLRRGAFDDKIDQYLGGTAGLEPRAPDSIGSVDSAPVAAPRTRATEAAPVAADLSADLSGPATVDLTEPMIALQAKATVPELPPLPMEDNSPTLQGDDAIEVIAAVSSQMPPVRAQTPPPIPARPAAKLDPMRSGAPPPVEIAHEPSSDVHVRFHDDEKARARARGSDSQPPQPRPASHGAAALPPVTRPPSRPSMTPPAVVSRPLTPPPVASVSDGRPNRPADEGVSDAIEVYAPAPPSAEPPPGERAARPGQYSVSRAKRTTENIPLKDKTGRIAAVPAGLMPPGRSGSGPARAASPSTPPASPATKPPTGPVPIIKPPTGPVPVVRPPTGPSPTVNAPASRPQSTSPIVTRAAGTPSNVVMARPAVIVGAPPKPAVTQQRVRKAREDEGRGFGQGLISEKSLDEVILAYLSEDAKNEK
jgi:hypothetical protein